MKLYAALAAILSATPAWGAAVFAHFMVGNANNYTLTDWQTDIGLAQEAHIDAFAMNIAYGDDTIDASLALAFEAVSGTGFYLFFSFDYAGGTGPWPESDVIAYANQYFGNAGYYHYNGQPFVSTFEGPNNAADWITIKETTGCFFIPDWSSKGADAALQLAGGNIVDGLFNWAAWPWGDDDMTTYTDASYYQYLGKNLSYPDPGTGLPYMMAVSPWFFTNLPGYSKNWLWRGDDLWFDRWVEVIFNQPEFVEIITWNDYGESHYIGPLYDYAMVDVFSIGEPPYNYAANMPHDGWRKILPYVIDIYKTGTATITEEVLVGWYRNSPGTACGTGGTTGNTASQLQIEFEPYEVAQDKVFYSALLASDATVTVSIGGVSQEGSWTSTPDGGIGVYHGSVAFSGVGDVVITLARNGATIATISGGPAISDSCTDDITNWNAWVGSADAGAVSAAPTLTRSEQTCIKGTGNNNFEGLCSFACNYGYCPVSACVCLEVGAPVAGPSATGPVGYPIAGEDASYGGVCAFDCERGYCPDTACGTVSAPLSTPTVSDFSYPACVAGQVLSTVSDGLTGLCSFSCNYGFCPIQVCECTAQGALVDSNSIAVSVSGSPIAGLDDYGLCEFACSHGYCPDGACISSDTSGSGSGSSGGDGTVYVSPNPWTGTDPTVGCVPPCTLIFPPLSLQNSITVTVPPYETALYSSSSGVTVTVYTTITIEPFPIGEIPFWPITIGTDDPTVATITPVQSIMPPSMIIPIGSNEAPIDVTTSSGATGTMNFTGAAPTWGSSSITIQPMPSVSIPIPTTDFPSKTTTSNGVTSIVTSTTQSVHYTRTSTNVSPSCTADCGKNDCGIFGCWNDCGTFGCGGGCGIFGCGGGGCGILGCGGGGWGDNGCGPAGCGCTFGCEAGGEDGNGANGCNGPSCTTTSPDDCTGSDCSCEATKTVTSCGVLCTETKELTTTVTGECSTTTCVTTSCGVDTTKTQTTTITAEELVLLTETVSDPIWTEDLTDAFVTSMWSDVLSWWSVESAAASATITSSPTTTGACISAAITYTSKASGDSTWQDTVLAYGSKVCSGSGSCGCTDWMDDSCESGYSFEVSFDNGDLSFPPIVQYTYIDGSGDSQSMTFSTESPDEVGPCQNDDASGTGTWVDNGGSDCVFTYRAEFDSC